jgi:uncharacterized phage protein gp47/JayE
MADNLPTPKSYEELLGEMLQAYAAKLGINDFNVGSTTVSLFEVVALTTARSSGDIFQILTAYSVDRATGDTLKRLAQEFRVTPIEARPSTGFVTVSDTTFQKISTKVYAGANPPNVGSTQIKVSDASAFPSSGAAYIGRGTPNIEGPLAYTSITPIGGFYVLNLSAPTTKFHNVGETVILSQGGNRLVNTTTMPIAPSVGANPDIQFSVTVAATILDGETEVTNVPVSAVLPGASGNVPAGGIKDFAVPPFTGAAVTNPLAFTTGADSETDDELRIRIKRALASTGLGTATAIESAVIGASPSDENATVVSDSIVNNADGAILYIDDGTGYEAKVAGVGLEHIVDSALGGEQFFQLQTGGRQAPVAKAFLESTAESPFDIKGGDTLAIIVGENTYEHVFADSDFRSPGGATAYEITASINADSALNFEATTSGGGINVVIRAKVEDGDSLQITTPTTNGRDAAVLLGFPSSKMETLRLYKNDVPLSKDGQTASIFSQDQALWSNSIADGDTLILTVDGTDPHTYTIHDSDFIAEGTYTTVKSTNSLESWATILNKKITGVTASIVGQQLKLTSNLGADNRASLSIDPSSSLVSKGMFSSLLGLSSQGKQSDFSLDRNTAQFNLTSPLIAGDKLLAGSTETEARIESSQISGGTVTLSADGHVWILLDAPGAIISTGVAGNTVLSVSKPSANIIRYTSSATNAFSTVNVGDYAIIWSEQLDPSDRFDARVHAVTSTTLDILVTAAEYAAAATTVGVVYSEGFVVLRSEVAPQKFRVTLGTKTLDQIADELQSQNPGILFSVEQEEFLILKTATKNKNGSLLIITSDTQGKLLGLASNSSNTSKDSLLAFYDSSQYDGQFPIFVHSTISTEEFADPIDSFVTTVGSAVDLSSLDPDNLLKFLHPYGTIRDAQPYKEFVQEKAVSAFSTTVTENNILKRLRSTDRFFVASPLEFGSQDTLVAVVDGDLNSKTFEIPFYRRAITNTSDPVNPFDFNAYDVDAGATASFNDVHSFAGFDFSNFKALMKAKKVLKPNNPKTALLYRSAMWGKSGEYIHVGYDYPTFPSQDINSSVIVNENISIRITLKSGAVILTSIDNTTEWNISVTPNTPSAGIDQVTYTYSGTGTSPALTLSGGEFVNITTQTEFSKNNTGVFRVSDTAGFLPTATSFSVEMPTGKGVAENNKATLANDAIIFYAYSSTTAADINTYVNSTLSAYVSSTIVNDGGTDGSGVIDRSTYEDSGFTYDSVFLLDGINWIASSNIGGSPQFTFKKALNLPTDVGYAFNNGEEVRLIPTTMEQVYRFIKVLAVTGFTTVGSVELIERGTRVSLSTMTIGSNGSIQIIGGSANTVGVPALDAGIRIDNNLLGTSVDKVASSNIVSGQWFKLQASTTQRKDTLFSSTTEITVDGNYPVTGQSTITALNRQIDERYFGQPRNHIRPLGRTFRIEKQGDLICLSWNGVGTSPHFLDSSVDFNDAGGGTVNVFKVDNSSDVEYQILSGAANFTELSIGDLITIAGMSNAANDGTFLVTGISDDGKILRVLNSTAIDSFSKGSFTLNTNSTAGDTFTIGASSLVAGTNFAIGATVTDTAANLAAVIGTLFGVSATPVGNIVNITATFPNASIALAYSGTGSVTVSGASLQADAFIAGDFSASTSVSEGDSMIISDTFAVLNQGKFRIIRRFNDSVWFENPNAVEEEVTLPADSSNLIDLGYDNTTQFNVDASENDIKLIWNGVGTEPNLGNAKVGDLITLGSDFSSGNQGEFMVTSSTPKLQEITQITVPDSSQFTSGGVGKYFFINSAGNANQYYVWFNLNSSNSDPAIGGKTGLQVAIPLANTNFANAILLKNVLNGATGLSATVVDNLVTVTTIGFDAATDATNVNVPAPFLIQILQQGTRTALEALNSKAANQSNVSITNVLTVYRPQILFYEYEATVPGDIFTVTGNTLGSTNAGSYTVQEVLNRDTITVIGSMASVFAASLNNVETSIYVLEEKPYSGYKRVQFIVNDPNAFDRNLIVFDTNAQYEKVDEAAAVEINSLNKMNYNTLVKKGLDSYEYNTGLIAEANRIIYGDPRDPSTYPGVGAAGAEIFVREPLTRKIQVAIDIRINTGIPFSYASEQVRTSVSSVVNSNPVGHPIAISAIVAAVNSIPGVRAVSISSPQYDSQHDILYIAPSEKARILDATTDVSVDLVGT